MTTKEVFKIIEELNYEYLLSTYNKKDNSDKKQKAKKLIKDKSFQLFFQKSIKHIPVLKHIYNYRLNKLNISRPSYYFSNIHECLSNKKIVVYTCITGDYDYAKIPYIKEENVDYIIFTNNINKKNDVWKFEKIPEHIQFLNNNSLINRYIKIHPHELFKDIYDYAIYIDGNIRLMSTIKDLPECINPETGIALHKHSSRDDIYDELVACKLIGRARASDCDKQMKHYKKIGMPKKLGLFECNAFIVDLHNDNSKKIFEDWWNDFINEPTKRDQPSFMYSLWKNKFEVKDVGVLGNNIFLNPKFRVEHHK